jgi:hypothetical protein
MKTFMTFLEEKATGCPLGTRDLGVNLMNRQNAIDNFGYGPMNPMEESKEFWEKKAKIWNVSVDYAKTSRCGNCAAFNISDQMRKCIKNGLQNGESANVGAEGTINKADLGYCVVLHFKCAGTRTCDAWLTNGPLDNKDV